MQVLERGCDHCFDGGHAHPSLLSPRVVGARDRRCLVGRVRRRERGRLSRDEATMHRALLAGRPRGEAAFALHRRAMGVRRERQRGLLLVRRDAALSVRRLQGRARGVRALERVRGGLRHHLPDVRDVGRHADDRRLHVLVQRRLLHVRGEVLRERRGLCRDPQWILRGGLVRDPAGDGVLARRGLRPGRGLPRGLHLSVRRGVFFGGHARRLRHALSGQRQPRPHAGLSWRSLTSRRRCALT